MTSKTESTRTLLSSSQLFGFNAGSRSTTARRGSKIPPIVIPIPPIPGEETMLDEGKILDTLNAVQTASADIPAGADKPTSTEAA